ncbi:MAG TPA: hypothetical protein VGD54_00510 [Steroidobacteraceae bacterium]
MLRPVQRSWIAGTDDPDFWNPKLRAPICFNAPAVRLDIELAIADLRDSPVLGAEDKEDRLTVFMIPLGRWSDGTIAEVGGH